MSITNRIVEHGSVMQEVHRLHQRLQDFSEGDLEHRINRFDRFVLKSIPIANIRLNEWDLDEDKVQAYIELFKSTGSCPPIVFDGVDESIIDGMHRLNALSRCGIAYIDAYVGTEENVDPTWIRDLTDELDDADPGISM